MITENNIASHELIGLFAQVVESDNKQIIGVEGKVVDETKFMLTLETKNGLKKFPKDTSFWRLKFNNGEARIDGTKLTKRAYERVGAR